MGAALDNPQEGLKQYLSIYDVARAKVDRVGNLGNLISASVRSARVSLQNINLTLDTRLPFTNSLICPYENTSISLETVKTG